MLQVRADILPPEEAAKEEAWLDAQQPIGPRSN